MSRREVYGTGMEVVITMDLVGLVKAGVNEIDKAKRELGLKIEKCDRGPAAFTVVFGQVETFNRTRLKFLKIYFPRALMTRRKRS